jgi:hypothetical protein
MDSSHFRKMANYFLVKPNITVSQKLRTALSLLFYALLLISCSPETTKEKPVTDQGYSQRYTAASFTVEQHISKKEITTAEQIQLVLDASAPENVAVEFPTYSAGLGDFTLKDTRVSPARMTGPGDEQLILHRITYILEPYLSGTYTIPAMTVTFSDKKNAEDVIRLVTREFEVPVLSLLAPDTDQVAIKDIKPPYALPPDREKIFLLAGLMVLLAAVVIYGYYFRIKKSSPQKSPETRLKPEEIARRELDRLLAEDLLAKGEIKLFHLRISDILRHYIENRFGLKAPERTTEEFLLELSQAESTANVLLSIHKNLLADFLSQCDLVKFAKHEPSLMESQITVDICREFIEKTKELGSRS